MTGWIGGPIDRRPAVANGIPAAEPRAVEFFVPGIPAPKGSMKAFMPKGWKRPVVTHDNAKTKPWQSAVQSAAFEAFTARALAPFDVAVCVRVEFFMPRPQGHTGAKGLKPSAPRRPATKPDLDKLTRLVGDALKGIAYTDDSRVVELHASKYFADGGACGARVVVEAVS